MEGSGARRKYAAWHLRGVSLRHDQSYTAPQTSFANNASTERWTVKRPGGLTGSEINIAGLAATMTDVLVRVENLDGTTQVTRLTPSSPSFVVAAAPGALEMTRTYLVLGVEHILFGIDHLLFVLALLIIVRGWRKLGETITAFTIAHSITLAHATLGFVHVPANRSRRRSPSVSSLWPARSFIGDRDDRGLTEAMAVDRGVYVWTSARTWLCRRIA